MGVVSEIMFENLRRLEEDNKSIRVQIETEHENYLTVHRENMKAATRIMELKEQLAQAESKKKAMMEKMQQH